MAPLATTSRACLRKATVSAVPAVRAMSTTAMRPADQAWTSYSSPFKGEQKAGKVPDFGKYYSGSGEGGKKLFSYFMVGSMGAITAAGAKSTVQGGLFYKALGSSNWAWWKTLEAVYVEEGC